MFVHLYHSTSVVIMSQHVLGTACAAFRRSHLQLVQASRANHHGEELAETPPISRFF